MTHVSEALQALGWNDWFAQRAQCEADDGIARVAAVDRDQWLLIDAGGMFRAKLAGAFMHRQQAAHEAPCVGDWVCVRRQPSDDFGMVHAVLERRTVLQRKAVGSGAELQMIAANVDVVVIVQSCHFDFNLKRLERYLVMVREGGADPIVLLTKTDLVAPELRAAQEAQIRAAGIDVPILALSNLTQDGVDALERLLVPGKTYCFVGSSGVGKSTLINHLIGRVAQETGTVSGTGEGRHTTVRRELIRLNGGALVIDNPGMREFGIVAADEGLAGSYADIDALGAGCRFRDCTHTRERGCAVLAAVESGVLSRAHYDNFLKLRAESAFHEMSQVERRQKDRDFGKFIKSVKKSLKDD